LGNEVFANGNEIACKSGDAKVIAAFPDVCLSPPSPPAGPIPVPYPDTSFSKDMKNGSKKVKIDGKEVMLKDKSFYKTSPLGNEAATKSLGAGVVSHVITGKTYFVAWSMDVKFEGQNVDRHLDLTTSNHASPMCNEAAPIPSNEEAADKKEKKCPPHENLVIVDEKDIDEVIDKNKEKRKKLEEKKEEFKAERDAATAQEAKDHAQVKIDQCQKGIDAIDKAMPSDQWEKKVADDLKAQGKEVRTKIKIKCNDCKKVITEIDVLSSDVAKEAKGSSNGFDGVDGDQYKNQTDIVERQGFFGEGIKVHIAVPASEVDELIKANPELDKDRVQGHNG
jgi:hypothetical protein